MNRTWETVIGLEVHVELATASKMFCTCTAAFGGEPNTHCCPVCMGLPGTLPTLNGEAVRLATLAALALNCTVMPYHRFDRKNYFYPDLPKAYQISQLYLPLARDGHVTVTTAAGVARDIRIHELHMEEDAGKLIHDADPTASLVDYNRCGVPLIEIVSEPDFRTAEEVSAYLETLCAMFRYAGISDCKMQEGSLRADVNISVRPQGQTQLGTRTELKNLNSFKAIERAIAYESARQIDVLTHGGTVTQETRRWDDGAGVSLAMRSKENAQDYRYFPEPDLPPLYIDAQTVETLRASLPEFAAARAARFVRDYGLSACDADILCADRTFAALFEDTVAAGASPRETANYMLGTVRKCLNDTAAAPQDIRIAPSLFAAILARAGQGVINRAAAVALLEEFLLTTPPPDLDLDDLIAARALSQIRDDGAILAAVARVVADHPAALADYHAGKKRAEGFLIGQTMKALQGRADPAAVSRAVKQALQQTQYEESENE